ncbi:MAG: MFS transporter [Patescibacteria group bacterium]
MEKIKSPNIPIMYATTIIGGMLFFLPVLALYFEKSLFSITNVAIIFSVEAIAIVIFEIPTGAIADLFGRRKTMIFSNLIVLCALVFLSIGGSMTMFVLYAILNAFARSLTSGTDSALIYDSLKEENKEHLYKKIIGTYMALWPLGASLGSIIGGYLAKISLQLTVLASFIPILIIFVLSFFLKEPKYEKENHQNILRHMFGAVKTILSNKQLIIIICTFLFMIALSEPLHLLDPLFFKYKNIPIEYFGWISALTFAFSSLGFYLSHYLSEKIGNRNILILVSILCPLFILTATLNSGILLVVFWATSAIYFGIKNPVVSHLLNSQVNSSKRATVISINNFMGQLGTAAVLPLLGYFAELYNIQTAIQLSILASLIIPIMLLFIKEKK